MPKPVETWKSRMSVYKEVVAAAVAARLVIFGLARCFHQSLKDIPSQLQHSLSKKFTAVM